MLCFFVVFELGKDPQEYFKECVKMHSREIVPTKKRRKKDQKSRPFSDADYAEAKKKWIDQENYPLEMAVVSELQSFLLHGRGRANANVNLTDFIISFRPFVDEEFELKRDHSIFTDDDDDDEEFELKRDSDLDRHDDSDEKATEVDAMNRGIGIETRRHQVVRRPRLFQIERFYRFWWSQDDGFDDFETFVGVGYVWNLETQGDEFEMFEFESKNSLVEDETVFFAFEFSYKGYVDHIHVYARLCFFFFLNLTSVD